MMDGNQITGTAFKKTARSVQQRSDSGPSSMLKIKAMAAVMPSGVTYHDEKGRITFADKSAQNILGLPEPDLLGKTLVDPIWQMAEIDGKLLTADQTPITRALKSGEIISDVLLEIRQPETKHKRLLLVTAIPILMVDESNPKKILCQIRDVTDLLPELNHIDQRLTLLQKFWQTLRSNGFSTLALREFYEKIVQFLPNVLESPNSTHIRIKIDGQEFCTEGFATSSIVQTAPLLSKQQELGQVELHYHGDPLKNSAGLDFETDHVLINALAEWLSLNYTINELNKDLEIFKDEVLTAYDRTIEAWSAALETQDKEASGHTQRVTDLALALAKEMGFDGEDLLNIRRGALLHDIGKLSIPDEIILKPGKLTEDEFRVIKEHPKIANKWLSQIELLKPALQIPYYHHEKWDGTGYPQGLSGEDIPLVARMFAIVDVWDALISDQPYRLAMNKEEALDLIVSEAGRQFDPDVVEAFLKVISEEGYFSPSHAIKVQSFGQMRVWAQGRRITTKDWQVYAARDLFFLLINYPDGLTKEQVGLYMWPDISTDELDVRFKNTLYRLRRAVGNQVVLLKDDGYRFNQMMDYYYDAEVFATNIEKAKTENDTRQKIKYLVKAVQQYQGEYLPEVDGHWAIVEREGYRIMHIDALDELADIFFHQGEYGLALSYCEKALKEDPMDEKAHRIAMRVHAVTGNQAELVRQYENCCEALAERFSIQPSQKTQELFETLVRK